VEEKHKVIQEEEIKKKKGKMEDRFI